MSAPYLIRCMEAVLALCLQILSMNNKISSLAHMTDLKKEANKILPLELIDQSIGGKLWVITRGSREFTGTLRGFDDYVNLVLDDAVEWEQMPDGVWSQRRVGQILLNGTSVTHFVPGGR